MPNLLVLDCKKAAEIEQTKSLFDQSRFRVVTSHEAGIPATNGVDYPSLAKNTMRRAALIHELLGEKLWVMADDAGLFIEALDGQPGIKAARWGEKAAPEEIMNYALERLQGQTNRKAYFRTHLSLVAPKGERYGFIAETHGTLVECPTAVPTNDSPYGAIFMPEGKNRVWAELNVQEQNELSHRNEAFRQALLFLNAFHY